MNKRLLDEAPSPVCRAYRRMVDSTDPERAYPAIALFCEPLIKWFGAAALVLLRRERPHVLSGTGVLSKFLSPPLGAWVEVIRLAVKELEQHPNAHVRSMFAELTLSQSKSLQRHVAGMEEYLATRVQKKTLLDFLECCVAYRNKTRGHGAPSSQHQREFSPVLLEAYDELLARLETLCRLKLVVIENAELRHGAVVHVLRICNGLNSFILPERLTLAPSGALSSETVHLFSPEQSAIVELSPILVRPPGRDAFYFLNGSRNAVEYLCYDGAEHEYYRPDGYREEVSRFLDVEIGQPPDPQRNCGEQIDAKSSDPDDLDFGALGM